jgi:hypothetical protein
VRKRMGKAAPKVYCIAALTAYDAANRSLAFTGTDKLPAHFAAQVSAVLLVSRLDYNSRRTVEHAKARKPDFNSLRFAKP